MKKKYLSKIIARDLDSLQIISACTAEAKVKVAEIKYLPKNKIFLFSIERLNKEDKKNSNKINSIVEFGNILSTKLNNFKSLDKDEILKLFAIDQLKKENNYEIILLFSLNRYITLSAEVIDIELTDQMTNDKDTEL